MKLTTPSLPASINCLSDFHKQIDPFLAGKTGGSSLENISPYTSFLQRLILSLVRLVDSPHVFSCCCIDVFLVFPPMFWYFDMAFF